jgi:hypothetical protein
MYLWMILKEVCHIFEWIFRNIYYFGNTLAPPVGDVLHREVMVLISWKLVGFDCSKQCLPLHEWRRLRVVLYPIPDAFRNPKMLGAFVNDVFVVNRKVKRRI